MRWAWPWQWGQPRKQDTTRQREEAERRLKAAKQDTQRVEREADKIAKMPKDQFADLVTKAFRRGHA